MEVRVLILPFNWLLEPWAERNTLSLSQLSKVFSEVLVSFQLDVSLLCAKRLEAK